MKQTAVLALFSFMVAAGSATWFSAVLAPPRPVVVAQAKIPAPVVASPGAAARPSTPTVPEGPTAGPDSGAPPMPADQTPAGAQRADTAGEGSRAKSVAKIIAAMKPKEAADIVARLSDDEVERIIRQLNAKQVAALLAVLPEERAALLSRRLLEPRTSRPGGT